MDIVHTNAELLRLVYRHPWATTSHCETWPLRRRGWSKSDWLKGAGPWRISFASWLCENAPRSKHIPIRTRSSLKITLIAPTLIVNLPSEIDLDLKYSDFALINKSNGMVSESRAYFSEQLNFGEPIHNKNGFDVTMMKITITSHVSLIETNYFGYAESQRVSFHFFVKLVVPKSNATVSINKKPSRLPSKVVSNSSHTPLNTPSPSQQHNLTNSSSIPLRRSPQRQRAPSRGKKRDRCT